MVLSGSIFWYEYIETSDVRIEMLLQEKTGKTSFQKAIEVEG